MRVQDYYNQLVGSGRRNMPTFNEARRDLTRALSDQIFILR